MILRKNKIFLPEFIYKITFISNFFNYNIQFLNKMSVRWWFCLNFPANISGSSAKQLALELYLEEENAGVENWRSDRQFNILSS
jgi:hypothetical protein